MPDNVSFSSELMTNYGLATVMSPDEAFDALQTSDGRSILISVGSDGALYAVVESPGTQTGWVKTQISSSIPPAGSAALKSFAVAQNQTTGLIDLIAVTSGTPDVLYVSIGNSSSSLDWLQAPTWTAVPYDDASHAAPSPFLINDVSISQATDGEYIVADIVSNPSGQQSLISRYFIDPTKAVITGQAWVPCDVPVDMDAATITTVLGRRQTDRVDGYYTIGTAAAPNIVVYQPLYDAFDPKVPPNPARLVLPAGVSASAVAVCSAGTNATDLYVAANSALYYFPAAGQSDHATAIQLCSDPSLLDVDQLYAFASSDTVTLLCHTRANQVIRMQCALGSVGTPASWTPPIPIFTGTAQLAPYLNRVNAADTLFLSSGTKFQRASQSAENGVWQIDDILLPADTSAPARKQTSYTTRIAVVDENLNPASNVNVQLSASSTVGLTINDVYYVLSPQPIPVPTDALGKLTIVEWVSGLTGTQLTVQATGGTPVAINPMNNPFERVAALNTPTALTSATITNADGSTTPLVPPNQPQANLEAVASAVQALSTAYGSLQSAPASRRLAGAVPGTRPLVGRELTVFATVRVGTPNLTAPTLVHPMGFGDAIAVAAGDLLDWLKSATSFVVQIAKDTASGAWHFLATIGDKIYTFIFDTVQKVVASLESIFKAIATAIEDLIDYLKFLFAWQDILRTRDVIKKIILFNAELALDGISTIKTDFDGMISDAKTKVNDWAAIKGDGWTPSVDNGDKGLNYLGTLVNIEEVLTAPAMFLFDHILGNMRQSSGQDPATDPVTQQIIDRALAAVQDQGSSLVAAAGQVQANLIDGSAYASLDLADILKKLTAIVVDAFLNASQVTFDALMDMLVLLGQAAVDAISLPIRIPVVSDIIEDVLGIGPFSVLDAMALVAAIPATVGYKLLKGSAPFPSGDTFYTKLTQSQNLQQLAAAFGGPTLSVAPKLFALGDDPAETWTPVNAANQAVFIVGHVVAGVGGFLATAMTLPSMINDSEALGAQYETALGVCGVVSGISAGLATLFMGPCPIINPHIARLSTASNALTVIGKVGFAAAPYVIGGSSPAGPLVASCKKIGAGFDTIFALLGTVASCYHYYELSQIPASRERTAAILEETGAVCSQMGRCATFAARMDEEPVSKAALVVLMTVLTALTAGFQVAEAITAATTSEQPLQLA